MLLNIFFDNLIQKLIFTYKLNVIECLNYLNSKNIMIWIRAM